MLRTGQNPMLRDTRVSAAGNGGILFVNASRSAVSEKDADYLRPLGGALDGALVRSPTPHAHPRPVRLGAPAGCARPHRPLGSSALAQALQPTGPPQAPAPEHAPPALATTPDQPSQTGAVPISTSPEVRRHSIYRDCVRAAKRRGLRGAKRRSFVTRCRLGREPVVR
jgi:hypothetical protein